MTQPFFLTLTFCFCFIINSFGINHSIVALLHGTFHTSIVSKPVIEGTMYTTPDQMYQMNIEVMRTYQNNKEQKVSSITVNCGSSWSESFGSCRPSNGHAEGCTFYDCSRDTFEGAFNTKTILCNEQKLDVKIEYSHPVNENERCKWKHDMATAVARVTLNPRSGIIKLF